MSKCIFEGCKKYANFNFKDIILIILRTQIIEHVR